MRLEVELGSGWRVGTGAKGEIAVAIEVFAFRHVVEVDGIQSLAFFHPNTFESKYSSERNALFFTSAGKKNDEAQKQKRLHEQGVSAMTRVLWVSLQTYPAFSQKPLPTYIIVC